MARRSGGPRGTTNRNERGNSKDRAARRAYLLKVYESDVPGTCRCYRCGVLLTEGGELLHEEGWEFLFSLTLTVDRIIPGNKGGTYRRSNIRPACPTCNSATAQKAKEP